MPITPPTAVQSLLRHRPNVPDVELMCTTPRHRVGSIVNVSCPESSDQFSMPIDVCCSSHLKSPLIGRNLGTPEIGWTFFFPIWRDQWKHSINSSHVCNSNSTGIIPDNLPV